MKKLKTIAIIFVVVLFVISLVYSGYSFLHRNDTANAYKIAESYKDKFGRSVKTVNQIIIDLNEARAAEATAKHDRSDFQKELVWLYGEYDALKQENKNLKAATIVITETTGGGSFDMKDSIIYTYKDSLIVDPTDVKSGYFTDGYLSQIITMPFPYYEADCQYSMIDSTMIFDTWIRQPNKKGKQVFWLWRWIKPWEVRIDVKSTNERVTIITAKKILINNKRRNE